MINHINEVEILNTSVTFIYDHEITGENYPIRKLFLKFYG